MLNSYTINSRAINGTEEEVERVVLYLQVNVSQRQQIGFIKLDLNIVVFEQGSVSLPLQIDVIFPSSQLKLALQIHTFAKGMVSQPLVLGAYDNAAFNQLAYRWKVRLILDGIDVSSNLTDTLRVEAEEGTAKIAEFSLIPFAGPIAVTKWIGKSITIFYQVQNTNGSLLGEWLLFQGVVDEPIYNPTSRVTNFTCTDQLQEKIQSLTKSAIDKLIGGYISPIVFEATQDNWQYAQNQLSTIPGSVDLDKNNQFRLTTWVAKETSDFIFSEENIIYQSLEVQLANRREIQNQANLVLQYRYQRLKQREIFFGFSYQLSFCEQNYWNATLPNVDMIEQAISGTGWLLKNKVEYVHQRGPGWVACGNVTFGFLISEEIRKYLVREAKFILAKRFAQTVTENYHLQLQAPQSINQLGEISFQENISFEVPADTDKFVNSEKYQAPLEVSKVDSNGDFVFEAEDRGQLDHAIVTKLNQMKTTILKSHRNNLVTFKTTIHPLIERHHTVKVDTINVKAQGKVKHIVHECDFNQGLCQSTITIAVSRTDDDMQINEAAFSPPQKVNRLGEVGDMMRIILPTHLGGRLDSLPYDEKWDGYTGNKRLEPGAKDYPEKFAITVPAIDSGQAPVNYESYYRYDFSIPNELLLLSA